MSVRCQDFVANYRTGDELVPKKALEAHADQCRSCDRIRSLVTASGILIDEPDPYMDFLEENVHAAVMGRVRLRLRETPRPMRRYWLAAACCALFFLSIAGGVWINRGLQHTDSAMLAPEQQQALLEEDQPIVIEILPPDAEWQGQPNRVRFVVKGLGSIVEQGEIELDEPVMDTVNSFVLPASVNGL